MKAVVFAEANAMGVQEVAEPALSAGHVLVRVRATTICATDMKILTGRFPGTRFPHIPGHEWSGEVAAVADDVDEIRVGDRVGVEVHVGCGRCPPCVDGLYNLCDNYGLREKGHAHIGFTVPGGLAEYCAVPVRACHKLPDGLSFEEGAFTDNIGVALWAVERARVRPGEKAVVVGPGAFGLLAVQVLRAMGVSTLALVGTRPERLELGLRLGADVTVNVREQADPVAAVKRIFGGKGPDAVVEFAGTAEAALQSLQMVRRGGRVVLAGSTGLGNTLAVDLSTIVRGHLEVLGSVANPRWVSRRGLELIARGAVDVKPLITHRFGLTEFSRAWDAFFQRLGGAIRVMMDPAA